jgi:2-keto-4-pentenoate hydratase/2-oxohepta-3-ene-1,7-dioic acid hydratase in catechol pathway
MAQLFVATIAAHDGPASAVVRDGLVHRIPGAPGVRKMLAEWERWLDAAAAEQLDDGVPLAECTMLPPIVDPPNLYMVGANYGDHAREMAGLGPDDPITRSPSGPFFFLKPTTTLIGNGAPVPIGEGIAELDWEVELAAVIGVRAERVSEQAALDHVFGYMIVNDVSARDVFVREAAPPPFRYDWLAQKGRAASAPCGPWILPARDCPDPGRLGLRLSVNEELMQDSSTAQMLFSLEEQIAYLSRILPLAPGDIIATGTCAGVGAGRGRFLAPGDVMRAEIESIGALVNPVEAAGTCLS